jgi:Homeodomain-like domain
VGQYEVVRPETVIGWHRRGFRLFWTWKSRPRTGRPGVPKDVRALIRELATANPLWGALRIHGELQKLGISVSQSTVAKYMRRDRPSPSQSWRTFLTNHAHQIMAADFFVVPTLPAGVGSRHPRPRRETDRACRGDQPSNRGVDGPAAAQRLP